MINDEDDLKERVMMRLRQVERIEVACLVDNTADAKLAEAGYDVL
jgi:hypothetical protein